MKKRFFSLLMAAALLFTGLFSLGGAMAQGQVDVTQKEAPELLAKVEAGTLPPLEERVPLAGDIMVEPDVMALGAYGGGMTMYSDDNGRWDWGTYVEQPMFRFKQDGSGEVEPNVAKEFYANEDSTVWTIKLREGMKWSDGQPFTADDVVFYYDHMSIPALNEDRSTMNVEDEQYYSAYTSKPYNCYQVEIEGKRHWATVEKVSDTEVTVTFAAPKPSFAVDVAIDNKWMFLPKHFYVNYVARKDGVTDDASFPLITEEEALANANKDFGKQWEAYGTMGKDIGYYHWEYAQVPQVRTFIAVKDNWNAIGETYKLVRNPYFWKTDSEGRQLPYLDELNFKIINEKDQITLQAMAGTFDRYEAITDYSTVATALQDTHNLVLWRNAYWFDENEGLEINLTVKDLDKRALFEDVRFREALSICVDRNLLNETLRNGVSEPWQASPMGCDEEWSKKWTEFNVEKANALMDEMTEPWDGAPGTYRKMKGTDKDVEMVVSRREASKGSEFITLLKSAFATIGVKLSDKIDAELKVTSLTNDVEVSVLGTSLSTPALRPDAIVPMRNHCVWYGAYGKWYEDGKSEVNGGIAPKGDLLKVVEAYDAMKAATGEDRNQIIAQKVDEIYNLHKENLWLIGYLKPLPVRNFIHKRVQNYPADLLSVDEFRYQSLARPEQWWVRE